MSVNYHHGGAIFMTVRAGRIAGDKAAPDGGMMGAMGAIAANLTRAGNGGHQLDLGFKRTADGSAMVSVRGELDIATAEQAHSYLRRILDGEKKGKVILNLAD